MNTTAPTARELAEMTPAQIDTALAALWALWYRADSPIEALQVEVKRLEARKADPARIARVRAEVVAAEDKAAKVMTSMTPYENEYVRRGGWTRYFLVDNKGGHIHNGRSCSTCRVTTQYRWLVEYAARPADEMYADEEFGAMVCTTCYPDAPVAAKAPAAPVKTGQCDGTPAEGQGARLYKKCGKCAHVGSARAWRKHKPKTDAAV